MFFIRFVPKTLLLLIITSNYALADVISGNVAVDIQEPVGTYDSTTPSLVNMFAKTVIEQGVCTPTDYTGCTFNDVLNDIDSTDDFKPEVKVHFTAVDFPDDGLVSNAKIRQRGAVSRYAPQKSFRIKLDSSDDLWRGERRIQLLKSFYELSRVRNKLSFDLFADIPHLPSMRTHFVNLELEDQGVKEELGLYTSIEHFGKEYLKRRGWDKDSRVYKAEHFYFQNRPAFALDVDGKPVNEDEFEKLVEIKRGKSHFEFVEMVEAVNNSSSDFTTEVFDKFFNQDNYLTWFAVNILVNNIDTDAHNYYLYNPKNTEKFYFIPWDYDYALGADLENYENNISSEHNPRWWYSHAYWWSNKLHKRFLKEPGNLALLKQAVTEIKNKYLTPEKIAAKRDAYYDVMFPILSSDPDWNFIELSGSDPEKVAKYNQVFNALSNNVEENYARFLERADDPMPFYMDDAVDGTNHTVFFDWDRSKSLSNQIIYYDLEISTSKEFTSGSIIQTVGNLSVAHYTLQWTHPRGTYYFRVIARDEANPQSNWQVSYDSNVKYDNGKQIYGAKEFFVSQDGDTTPPDDDISNPVNSNAIIIDGADTEWSNLTLFESDTNDIANNNTNVIDWDTVGVAHTDSNVYFLYKNHGSIDPDNTTGDYIPWGWQAYIDTDNNPDTGFKFSGNIGAEYIIEGTVILRYNGTGRSWNWDVVGVADTKFVNNKLELGFPRTWLGYPQSFNIYFQGANEAYGGTTRDNYPDGVNTNLFSYSFGDDVTPPANIAPVATGQNFSMVENTVENISLNATDADGDSLSVIITQQPTQGTVVVTGLLASYTPNPNYTGTDSFKFKVNDGEADSNIATVTLSIVEVPPPPVTVSNKVILNGITVNGLLGDWNNLTFFAEDPNDISISASNRINWLKAGLAHSHDTIYLAYQNTGPINPAQTSGDFIPWGWQTFIDADSQANTGYKLNDAVGAEYLIEGNNVFQYAGSGWNWTLLGSTELKYTINALELSFPRAWLTSLTDVKVAFYGNNEAFGGNTFDSYPDQGGFDYSFGSVGQFRISTPIASGQSTQFSPPESHRPKVIESDFVGNSSGNTDAVISPVSQPDSKGGSFSWLLLFAGLLQLLLLRRKTLNAKGKGLALVNTIP